MARLLLLIAGLFMTGAVIKIGPQPGPQTKVLACAADIAIYGGAAGGGKSFALLLDPIRHYSNPDFAGVIFRRNTVQIRNPGGLWDASTRLYGLLGARPRETTLEWLFAGGMKMKFGHLEHDSTVLDWQGAEIAYLGFDELTHFSERQFWYMLSRLRSTSGVPGYVRATTNPDADSWVRRLITWWIDDDGYPVAERSGVLRWFVRINDELVWGDTREELVATYGEESMPKSLTFIAAKLQDNKILMAKDPAYLANLRALPRVDRLRLEGGNWNVRASAGTLFRREWFPVVDAVPAGAIGAIRYWDRAATEVTAQSPDPDWTRGLKLLRLPDGRFLVADLRSARERPSRVEELVRNVASQDGRSVQIMSQQDPGSAGKGEAEYFVQMLAGYMVKTETTSKDKVTRAKPVSAQSERGNIAVLRAPWNKEFFDELEAFPEGVHDDIVDTLSGAFNELTLHAPGTFGGKPIARAGTFSGSVTRAGEQTSRSRS